MLELKNISKKFRNNLLYEDVNFEIKKGELIHLFGKNGSGKSTLFMIICDILEPTTGEILREENVKIGAVIGNSGFIENETILYNLKYLYNLKGTFDEEKVKDLCEMFSLDLYNRKKLSAYSVGMRQKVAIIQAIMEEQNLILFDEPTRGLDVDAIDVFFKLIKKLKKEGKTVVIASHDLYDKLDYDYHLLIKNQRIVKSKKYEKV